MTIRHVLIAVHGKIIAVGAEVVVDHVQDDSETSRMRRIDKALERVLVPIDVRRRKQVDAVVAPIPSAGKFRQRHQFDERDPAIFQFIQLSNRGIEAALRSECADMELINHLPRHADASP